MLKAGLWPVACYPREKRPIGRAWGATYPTREKLLTTFEQHHGAGVGIALGPVAGVVDFDVDGKAESAALIGRLGLQETLGWSSARGDHSLFLWDKRLEGRVDVTVAHFDGCELRVGGEGKQLVSVCPPSVGDDRRCRRWNGVWEIAPLPESLLRELDKPRPRQARQAPLSAGISRYAQAALRHEARALREAKQGTRNNTLNRSAFSLGQLVAIGLLPREAVEAELTDAALAAGLGEREIASTLRSGLEAGMLRPRQMKV
jgi:hypothetical protein